MWNCKLYFIILLNIFFPIDCYCVVYGTTTTKSLPNHFPDYFKDLLYLILILIQDTNKSYSCRYNWKFFIADLNINKIKYKKTIG